jgi:hypothetical protein
MFRPCCKCWISSQWHMCWNGNDKQCRESVWHPYAKTAAKLHQPPWYCQQNSIPPMWQLFAYSIQWFHHEGMNQKRLVQFTIMVSYNIHPLNQHPLIFLAIGVNPIGKSFQFLTLQSALCLCSKCSYAMSNVHINLVLIRQIFLQHSAVRSYLTCPAL